MKLNPGALIVLEGPDGTGKTATWEALTQCEWAGNPLFTHQPSGTNISPNQADSSKRSMWFCDSVYDLTQDWHEEIDPLALQYLHLASHSQHYNELIFDRLVSEGVVMDRCWWSTVAYGFYGHHLHERMPMEDFFKVARAPTNGVIPNIVFMFEHQYREDTKTTEMVKAGYAEMKRLFNEFVVEVPRTESPSITAKWIREEIVERGYGSW